MGTTKHNALYAAISRRRALALGGSSVAGLAAAALIGCSSSSKDGAAKTSGGSNPSGAASAPATAASPKRGGTLKYPAKATPNSLDPYRSETGNSGPYLEYSRLFAF